jgi:hypothetical protein
MSKSIKFSAVSPYFNEVAPKPYPAQKNLPEWYRSMPQYYPDHEGKSKINISNRLVNTTARNCTPMFDVMTSGYILPLWSDVLVDRNHLGQPIINWRCSMPVFELHGSDGITGVPSPPGYSKEVFKYLSPWYFKTPKGYSTLIMNPPLSGDSTFQVVPAIVDTDKNNTELIFPLWINKDFTGIIKKGTPVAQIIPFKRDEWKSEFDFFPEGYLNTMVDSGFGTNIKNHYKQFNWTRKKFK